MARRQPNMESGMHFCMGFGVTTFGHVHRPEQLTTEVWDFIFFGGELPKESGISEEGLL